MENEPICRPLSELSTSESGVIVKVRGIIRPVGVIRPGTEDVYHVLILVGGKIVYRGMRLIDICIRLVM